MSAPARPREALLALVEALGSREAALRRDGCGDWAIPGSLDQSKAPGFQIIVAGEFSSGRRWGATKRGLAFADVTNDGDDEGALLVSIGNRFVRRADGVVDEISAEKPASSDGRVSLPVAP